MRELRQHASRWLRLVAQGETFTVTVRGEPVAYLSPLPEPGDALARLVAEGRVEAAAEELGECLVRLGPPPAGRPLSPNLEALRRDER
ncbi:MAG: type II toxin-antitoxin system prevent-host-death family antitoxin [bacterium]|nr:type II toxin-antitoxin system prevent-host-death family antitoxin [bacterium]